MESMVTEIIIPKNKKLAVIKFRVANCPGCDRIAPFYKELESVYSEIAEFYDLDFKDNRSYGPKYKLSKMPCVVIQNASGKYECISGVQHPDVYTELIKKFLEDSHEAN